jgi:hypothetical protein
MGRVCPTNCVNGIYLSRNIFAYSGDTMFDRLQFVFLNRTRNG